MRKLYLFAAMAAMLASCSSDDLTKESAVAQQNADDGAVVFDAYQSRGTTRAGKTGTMTLDVLKQTDAGFGVFGYYTNNEGYSELALPDFMYNQEVKYDNTYGWLYAPIKYWPNEFGNNAYSERVDYLSFFAYAPYVEAEPKTGKVAKTSDETGIIGMTRNTAIGDPLVKYVANFNPAKAVDLCWGVAAENFTSSVSTTANNIIAGKPFKDVTKPETTSKIKFDFKHALSQLNVQIDADINDNTHSHSNDVNDKTRIYVRSVSFEGFTDRGTLNLNSDAPNPTWYDISGTGNLSTKAVTIYDGRYDGREGVENVAAPAELPLGLNDDIIQSKAYTDPFGSVDPGVTKDAVNLFKPVGADADAKLACPILVIPNGQPLKVTIVYDVETYDPSLAQFLSDGKTKGSTIENAITNVIKTSGNEEIKLVAGKKYIVKLHLGLTSVKFDAQVSEWEPSSTGEGNVDLPANAGGNAGNAIAAGTLGIGGTLDVNMSAAAGTLEFTFGPGLAAGDIPALTGETRSPDVTLDAVELDGTPTVGVAGNSVDIKLNVPANTTTRDVTRTVTIKDAESTPNTATVTIHQAHGALGLQKPTAPTAGEKTFTLSCTASNVEFSTSNTTIIRKRGSATTTVTPTEITTAGAVTLEDAAQAGDIYTIRVQDGEADEEEVSCTVAHIPAEIVFTTANPSSPIGMTTLTPGTEILDNAAKLLLASDHITELGAAGGTITYNWSDIVNFDVTTDGKLKLKGTWEVGQSREVTVTASVAPGPNYSYESPSVSYTITVKAVVAP